jgi:hypothetical protein
MTPLKNSGHPRSGSILLDFRMLYYGAFEISNQPLNLSPVPQALFSARMTP